MESNPVPFLSKLFLYYYESKLIKKKKKSIRRARKFPNYFRFIDDLTVLHDGGESFREIYPIELKLQKENGE